MADARGPAEQRDGSGQRLGQRLGHLVAWTRANSRSRGGVRGVLPPTHYALRTGGTGTGATGKQQHEAQDAVHRHVLIRKACGLSGEAEKVQRTDIWAYGAMGDGMEWDGRGWPAILGGWPRQDRLRLTVKRLPDTRAKEARGLLWGSAHLFSRSTHRSPAHNSITTSRRFDTSPPSLHLDVLCLSQPARVTGSPAKA